jgi:hypothetical protein
MSHATVQDRDKIATQIKARCEMVGYLVIAVEWAFVTSPPGGATIYRTEANRLKRSVIVISFRKDHGCNSDKRLEFQCLNGEKSTGGPCFGTERSVSTNANFA